MRIRALLVASGVGSLMAVSVWAVSQAAASPARSASPTATDSGGLAVPARAKGIVKGICTGQTASVAGLAITCGGQNGSEVGYSAFVVPSAVANTETVEVYAFTISKSQDKGTPGLTAFDAGTSGATVYMAVKGQGANPNASVALSADRESSAPSVSELTDTAVQSSGGDLVMTIQAATGGATG
jgi:hypothetical protein